MLPQIRRSNPVVGRGTILRFLFLAIGAALTIALVSPLTGPGLATPPPPDYYPMPVNGKWEYGITNSAQNSTSTLKITILSAEKTTEGTVYTTEQDLGFGPSNLVYLKGNGWVKEIKFVLNRNGTTSETVNDPVKPILKNPPKTGDAWSWEGQKVMGGFSTPSKENYQVKAIESVTVPAGKFDAARVEILGENSGQKFHKIFWYVNQIGPVKWQILDQNDAVQTTTELTRYEFPKAG